MQTNLDALQVINLKLYCWFVCLNFFFFFSCLLSVVRMYPNLSVFKGKISGNIWINCTYSIEYFYWIWSRDSESLVCGIKQNSFNHAGSLSNIVSVFSTLKTLYWGSMHSTFPCHKCIFNRTTNSCLDTLSFKLLDCVYDSKLKLLKDKANTKLKLLNDIKTPKENYWMMERTPNYGY